MIVLLLTWPVIMLWPAETPGMNPGSGKTTTLQPDETAGSGVLTINPQSYDTEYYYDDIGRLIRVVYDHSWSVEYTYDAVGNIVSVSSGPYDPGIMTVEPSVIETGIKEGQTETESFTVINTGNEDLEFTVTALDLGVPAGKMFPSGSNLNAGGVNSDDSNGNSNDNANPSGTGSDASSGKNDTSPDQTDHQTKSSQNVRDLRIHDRSDRMTGSIRTTETHHVSQTNASLVDLQVSPAWLSVDPESGSVAPGDTLEIDITLDATGLSPGVYQAEITAGAIEPIAFESSVMLELTVTAATATEPEASDIPLVYSLDQNYPNPFNPVTTIRYGIPYQSSVRLEIYNILGQRVSVLVDREMDPGFHEIIWDSQRFASGVYLYRLEAMSSVNPNENFLKVRKMTVIK